MEVITYITVYSRRQLSVREGRTHSAGRGCSIALSGARVKGSVCAQRAHGPAALALATTSHPVGILHPHATV